LRNLAIGDIHGCLTALNTLLDFVQPHSDDRLITLGDYVDRGPASAQVLDRMLELGTEYALVPLRGNHDVTMLAARSEFPSFRTWMEMGGNTVLRSYNLPVSWQCMDGIPALHWQFLESTLPFYDELPGHFFVHANAYSDLPLAEQPEYMRYWEKFDYRPPHQSGKVMVCGHTSQKSGLPINIGHAVMLDTRVHDRRGWLTCLHVESGQLWQANEQGETRQMHLDELP